MIDFNKEEYSKLTENILISTWIWASGFYLTINLSSDLVKKAFVDKDKEAEMELDSLIQENKWEPFEYYDDSFIYEQIDNLTWSAIDKFLR